MKGRFWAAAVLLAGLALTAGSQEAGPNPYAGETAAERDARMQWWREARFGMFIHWGVYSVPAGTYEGRAIGGLGEWIMHDGRIPMATYQQYAAQFNPVKFNALEWVRLAKEAGQKYIIITSKHHDGFAMFDSKASDWNIVKATPFKRDPLKELADACRQEGLKLGFYYSQAQDWNNGGSSYGGKWDHAQNHDMDDYINSVAVPQVRELLTRYGDGIPAVFWWDTPCDMNRARAEKLIALLKLKPGIIHNNRLGEFSGDTETPEQSIPATGFKNRDWETCMTLNDTWGFKSYDRNWKPTHALLRNLIDIASKGGNYLLNVGPTAEGEIPAASVERLKEMGKWMQVNGEAIYGTTASPFRSLPWGRCTKRVGGDHTTLYLHVFDWPRDGRLRLPGVRNAVKSARLLAGGPGLKTEAAEDGVTVVVPESAPDAIASVIAVELAGPLQIEAAVRVPQAADGSFLLPVDAAEMAGEGSLPQVENKGGQPNVGFWQNAQASLVWTLKVEKPGAFDVTASAATPAGGVSLTAGTGAQTVTAVVPKTGSYEQFQPLALGRLSIAEPGPCRLTVRPVSAGWQPINLRALKLTPTK